MARSEQQDDLMVWGAVGPTPAPLPPARAARAAALALAEDLGLADLTIETRALGPGRVELLGWVPDRRRRALAERTVAALVGITGVVNRLLVEQEDSDNPVAELALADQSA
ncbi:MAG: BON domain-containing protein [Gemmatimonadetes bacterium]|nr:BON domain-containing protein [Gemmatimonadota bacterium]